RSWTDRDGSGSRYRRRDELLRLRLQLAESRQDPDDLRHSHGINEHERQDEIPMSRHRKELFSEQEDVTDLVGEHRAEGETEYRNREDPQGDRDVPADVRLRFLQRIKLEHDRLEHHKGEAR